MVYEPSFKHNDKIDSLCMEIAELVDRLSPDAPLARSPTLHRELRIRTIHPLLLIEGNTLDERAVTAILDGKRVLENSHDILTVENAQRAYDFIPSLNPYSIDDFLMVHETMVEGLVSKAGRFRSGNVGVFDAIPDSCRHARSTGAASAAALCSNLRDEPWSSTHRFQA